MDGKTEVLLYIYDLSNGLITLFTPILGKSFEGIWHTSIIVFDREYFFGQGGIFCCPVGGRILGKPNKVLSLGCTEIPMFLFDEYLNSLKQSKFSSTSYHLSENNCNNFSNELAIFLTGNTIPDYILNLPQEIFSTPIGETLKSLLNINITAPKKSESNISSVIKSIDNTKSNQSKIVGKMSDENANQSASNNAADTTNEDNNDDASIGISTSTRRAYKYDDPPIVFKDVDGITALKKVEELVGNLLNPEQQQLLKEIDDYLKTDSGAWAIGEQHLDLISYLLNGGEGKFPPNVMLLTLEVLQAASLKDDVVLILHQDRKDHRIMSYINKIENLTLAEQEEIVKLLCNLCGQPSTIDWLLYISEWCEENGQSNSNSRVTIRAAVHTLLNDQLTTLQRNGVYLIYNLSLKEVFEDVSIELATAVLQYMHSELPDDQALLSLTAITRFIEISPTDVPALIKMLGPDLNKYKGKNEKMDNLIKEIENKVSKLPSYSY